MTFVNGKFEGVEAADLPLEDVIWILRRSWAGVDRAIAGQELHRRFHLARGRRRQVCSQNDTPRDGGNGSD